MTTTPNPYFKVIKQPANGTKIAGKRRLLNAVFQAPEAQVRFQVLDGLIEQTDSAGVPIVVGSSGGTGQANYSNPANSGSVPAV